MVDPVTTARLSYRALYAGVATVVIFISILPVSTVPAAWPGPDILMALTVAWVLRRPDYVPALMIVAVFLIQDLISVRPPGLWALIMLLTSEFLRSRVALTRDLPFLLEWMMVATVMAAAFALQSLTLGLFVVPQAGFGPTAIRFLATVAIYPGVVAVSHWALGLRKVAPGEVDALGHRV